MQLTSSVKQALDHAQDAESRTAQLAATSLAAKIAVVQGLKTFPQVAQRAMGLLADPDFKVPDVTRIVKEDPSLTAGVIRLANSAFFSRGNAVDSVERAVVRLGRGAVREVVCSVATMELFADTSGYGAYVRDHCGSTAAIAQELVRDLVPTLTDGAYLAGLMHDVGKLLLMASGEIFYSNYEHIELHNPETSHLIERSELGYDHAVLGGQVLWHWKFPEPVPQAVAWHHSPELVRTDSSVDLLASILRVADHLEPHLGVEDLEREEVVDGLVEGEDCRFAGVSDDYMLEKWSRLEELKEESRLLFS